MKTGVEVMNLDQELAGLESAEDFLDYFDIDYDPDVLQVCRLHVLQRFSRLPDASGPGRIDRFTSSTVPVWLRRTRISCAPTC